MLDLQVGRAVVRSVTVRLVGLTPRLKIDPKPTAVENDPLALAKVITGKSWPTDAAKPLTRVRSKRAGQRGGARRRPAAPNRPLAGVPPIWTLSVPAAVWVSLPVTVSVLPAPTVRLPLLVKLPLVVKLAPPVERRLPLLEPGRRCRRWSRRCRPG